MNDELERQEKEWLVARYVKDGMTMEEVAVLAKVSAGTVRTRLIHHGIDRRPRGAPVGHLHLIAEVPA